MTKRVPRAAEGALSASRPRTRPEVRRIRWRRRFKTLFALSFLLLEAAVAIALVFLLMVFWNYSTNLPKVEELAMDVRAPVATTIWSNDGVLLGKLDVVNRQPVTLTEVPKNVINATIAIEDHRFYEHNGVDFQGIARAAWANVRGGDSVRQGGSTLTQQVVRNIQQFGITKEKKIERKLKEAIYALRLEQVYSKPEILQLYLNNVYYGGGAYGIQAAAKTYFGKPVSKLDLAQAALLAGLPQRPSEYSPFENLDAALRRRNDVLERMLTYGYINRDQYRKALAEKPHILKQRQRRSFDFKAPHFTTYVLNDLIQRYGADFVYSGLRIETTLNYKLQQMAERALLGGLANASGQGANQGALISLDNNTGYIRARVGGRSFHADQYNAITQGKRQPGSTFKVFDYSAAFDTGAATLDSTFMDEPIPYPNDPKHRVVKNYSGKYSYGAVDCLTGIKHSMNTIAVQVARKVGIRTVIDYAHRMGITTELAPYLPTALGASAVRPIDLCSAYSVFPAKGNRLQPMAIVRVTDADGNLIEEHTPQIVKTNILKSKTLDQMNTALEAVVTSGTGTRARGTEENGIVPGAHGKTGTTSDNRDAWFAGYTPELTTVIWVASVHRSKHGITYAQMPGATGGVLCAPIWHDFMIKAVPEERKFRPPQAIALAPHSDPFAPGENANKQKAKPKPKKQTEVTEAEQKDGYRRLASNEAPPLDEATPESASNASEPQAAPETAPPAPAPPPSLPAAAAPPVRQTVPIPPSRSAAASVAAPTGGGLRASAPASQPTPVMRPIAARPATPPPHPAPTRAPASDDMVTVRICVDSEQRANEFCDATKLVRMTRRQARRLGRCRLHRAPPGEE